MPPIRLSDDELRGKTPILAALMGESVSSGTASQDLLQGPL